MQDIIVNYFVPVSLFILMLIVGTEIVAADFAELMRHPRAVLIGVIGQLALLPPLVLLVSTAMSLTPFATTSLLLLALCPGGAISNYYCYLARCSISLSATITALGTLCSLASIPLWLALIARTQAFDVVVMQPPASAILLNLFGLMIVPMAIGIGLSRLLPRLTQQWAPASRLFSLAIVVAVLVAITWTVRERLAALGGEIVLAAVGFIFGAMLLGRILSYGMKGDEGPVLVIESAVRNVSVAIILGRLLFRDEAFGSFAGFLTGYFIIEVLIMVSYTQYLRNRRPAD